jgi:hypothetical protein
MADRVQAVTDKSRQELIRLLMQLIVGGELNAVGLAASWLGIQGAVLRPGHQQQQQPATHSVHLTSHMMSLPDVPAVPAAPAMQWPARRICKRWMRSSREWTVSDSRRCFACLPLPLLSVDAATLVQGVAVALRWHPSPPSLSQLPACSAAEEAEQAAPCICTPRELAAQAACFLNMLLDMFGAAEEAGGFQGTAGYR